MQINSELVLIHTNSSGNGEFLTFEAEPRKLGLKRHGDGERNALADRPLPAALFTGWYDGIIEPISSKLLL